MSTYETRTHIGSDRKLAVTVPAEFADADVRIVVEKQSNGAPMSRDDWRRFLDRVAGSIDDPTFERPPQLEFKDRKLFD